MGTQQESARDDLERSDDEGASAATKRLRQTRENKGEQGGSAERQDKKDRPADRDDQPTPNAVGNREG